MGGVAATTEFVIYSTRTVRDTTDNFLCVRSGDGGPVWSYSCPAPGALDYGNSPRATPLVAGNRVYVQGAMGNIGCLNLKTGEPVWEMSLKDEFEVKETPKWGFCASPLIVEGKLIVLPGAPDAGIAALDPGNGKVLWKTPGLAPGYGSLVVATVNGKKQIVGHDVNSLGGWAPATGKRLWRLAPKTPNDFNVPTPLPIKGGLIVCTENNGTRLHGFREDGSLDPNPRASFRQLSPDTHTPVIVGDRLYGVSRRLYCLGVNDLKPLGESVDPAFGRYCAIVASKDRVLVISLDGEMRLFSTEGNLGRPLAKAQIFPGEKGLYSHPAFVGTRMFARGSSQLACFDFGEPD